MFDIEDNVSVINLILIIMLFFNCVLSIDMYRQSYCNEDKDCPSYITIDKTNGSYMLSFEGYDERMVGSRLKPLAGKMLPFDYEAVVKEIKSYKEEGEESNDDNA